ncbi:MAG: class I SAM-dependent methyltransferase [Verrucomicrobiae bacterium]|nr:class I SAM-dependent methyltransferase [Verrucomicrobiae bacterium]MCP5540441.1 class I SAM-dependent methyltransferase [Akkermansiaceae bacterium]
MVAPVNIFEYNRVAWNFQSMEGCRWSTPVEDAVIERARAGDWSVILTPNKPVPADWFPASHPRLDGLDLLALASGGGQQAPVFAAAGARVTSLDGSDVQLEKDAELAERHGLELTTIQADMADLSALPDASFDLVFNPVSNVFAEAVRPIWKECARVLRPGGRLLAGFMNPCFFMFDHYHAEETGELRVVHRLPYSDVENMADELLSMQIEAQMSLEFSHSLQDQIGGQCDAGLAVTGLYEDDWDDDSTALNGWMPMYLATRSVKLPA